MNSSLSHITNSKQRKHRTVFPSAYGGTRVTFARPGDAIAVKFSTA